MRTRMASGDVRGAERAAASLPVGNVHSAEYLGSVDVRLAAAGCEGGAGGELGKGACAPPPVAYRRSLDLETAVATVSFRSGGCEFVRSAFVSARERVLVLRINSSCSFDAAFSMVRARHHRHRLT